VSWHVYGARFISEDFEGVSRDAFVKAMRAEGVPVSTGYPEPVYRYVPFQQDWKALPFTPFAWTQSGDAPDYRNLHLPKTEQYCKERLSLSQTLLLAEEDRMREVCNAFEKVREQAKALRDWEARG
jgi:dTDP-4-amino-4,6-dideoxygalactose transaminase